MQFAELKHLSDSFAEYLRKEVFLVFRAVYTELIAGARDIVQDEKRSKAHTRSTPQPRCFGQIRVTQVGKRKSPIENRDEARIKQIKNIRTTAGADRICTFALFTVALRVAADHTVIDANEIYRNSPRSRAGTSRAEVPLTRLNEHFDCVCRELGRPCPHGSMRSALHLSRGEFSRIGARLFANRGVGQVGKVRSLLGTCAGDCSRTSGCQKPSTLKIVSSANGNFARS